MVIDAGYWLKILRRILLIAGIVLGTFLAFRLIAFFMPFVIAFLISSLIEPIIRFCMKRLKLSRRISSVIVIILVIAIIVGLLFWGISSLVKEAFNLLQNINIYIDKAGELGTWISERLDTKTLHLPQEVLNMIQNSFNDVVGGLLNFVKTFLTSVIQTVTSIPKIGVYLVITILSIFFICVDRVYILDQVETQMPSQWMKKITKYTKDILAVLGKYLRAQGILFMITLVELTIGFTIFNMAGLGVKYPIIAALLIAVVDILPILGSGTVLIPWAVISALSGNIGLAIALFVLYVIVLVIRQFIEPKIVSGQIGVHPIFTLIAMYTGFRLYGVTGLVLGPIAMFVLATVFSSLIEKGVFKVIFDKR